MNKVLKLIFFLTFISFAFYGNAQRRSKIEVKGARVMESDKRIGGGVIRLIDNVVLKQDDVWIYCDSAGF